MSKRELVRRFEVSVVFGFSLIVENWMTTILEEVFSERTTRIELAFSAGDAMKKGFESFVLRSITRHVIVVKCFCPLVTKRRSVCGSEK